MKKFGWSLSGVTGLFLIYSQCSGPAMWKRAVLLVLGAALILDAVMTLTRRKDK